MSLTQRIFYWSMAAWLALSVAAVVWLAPWLRWIFAQHLAMLGAVILLVGMVAMIRECWRCWPADASPWGRWTLPILASLACIAAAAVATFYLPFRCGPDHFTRTSFIEGYLQWEVESFYRFRLGEAWSETADIGWQIMGVVVGVAVLILAAAWAVRRWLLPRRPVLSARRHIACWTALISAGVALVVLICTWGYEPPRRLGLAGYVALYSKQLFAEDRPKLTMEVKPASGGGGLGTVPFYVPEASPGLVCDINDRRCLVVGRLGHVTFWRPAPDGEPYTIWQLLNTDGTQRRVMAIVRLRITRGNLLWSSPLWTDGKEAYLPARRVWGPWYEWSAGLDGTQSMTVASDNDGDFCIVTY